MVAKQCNEITKKIKDILSNDETIKNLLFYANQKSNLAPGNQQILNDQYITDYPVILEANDKFSLINAYYDNSVIENNIYVSTFKISCGVSLDAYHLENGDVRVLLMADRIEELLSGKRLCNSTGVFELVNINTVYWNSYVTGVSLIFQVVEQGDLNETVI